MFWGSRLCDNAKLTPSLYMRDYERMRKIAHTISMRKDSESSETQITAES